ncbi:hypothetical protein OG971_05105 [Streptomyces sp. NBC_00847]|nr:hypothetical protein [Streptomyces sp. NBC_00847]MCX4879027.1 hypothetical protein [Streptomyces sp. NBC_00847]
MPVIRLRAGPDRRNRTPPSVSEAPSATLASISISGSTCAKTSATAGRPAAMPLCRVRTSAVAARSSGTLHAVVMSFPEASSGKGGGDGGSSRSGGKLWRGQLVSISEWALSLAVTPSDDQRHVQHPSAV